MSNAEHSEKDGIPGGSAREKYWKLDAKRKKSLERIFGARFGNFLHSILRENDSTLAWDKGAVGEIEVGKFLNELATKYQYRVLHDRKVPNSRANIDHIFITDRGVFVIDTKHYKGLIEVRDTLYIGGRKQENLVSAVKKQVAMINKFLTTHELEIPVYGFLAFYDGEFKIFNKPTEVDGILLNGRGIEVAIISKAIIRGINLTEIYNVLLKALPRK